jgi:hypothetical protein
MNNKTKMKKKKKKLSSRHLEMKAKTHPGNTEVMAPECCSFSVGKGKVMQGN